MTEPDGEDAGLVAGGLHAVDEWLDLTQLRAFTNGLATALRSWGRDAR